MQTFLLVLIYSLIVIAALMVGKRVYAYSLPGMKRFRKNYRKQIGLPVTYKDKSNKLIKNLVPKNIYDKLNDLLYQTGQISDDWTVEKLIKNMAFMVFFGIVLSFVFLSLSDFHPGMILISFVLVLCLPFGPIIIFYSKRNEYLSRMLYAAPDFIDVLEKEMVNGTGNPFKALEMAEKELIGELKIVLQGMNKALEKDKGNLNGAIHLLKRRVNHQLFDQIQLVITTGYDSGRYMKMFTSLHKSSKSAIEEVVRKQTARKNLLLACVGIGLVLNFSLLFLVPFVLDILGQLKVFSNL
ncbi:MULTISPECIES: hypothetical protein [Bacillota]|uniref:hypothetical protein n=1 Tax=Bacillota TaxID=1239 RepID=UPI0039F12E38